MQAELITNPYKTRPSPFGPTPLDAEIPGLLLRGPWSAETARFMVEREIGGLYLNSAQGWSRNDYEFLREVPGLRLLDIVDLPIADLSPVAELSALESLGISAQVKGKLDFGRLKKLRHCAFTWWRGAQGLSKCSALEKLDVRGIDEKELDGLSQLRNLRELTLQSNLRSLRALGELPELEKLVLLDCRNLEDVSALAQFPKLRWLAIDGSKKIANFTHLGSLRSLEVLDLSNCGKIPSLAPLASLQKLKAFAFPGATTSIEDGDLGVLTSLPELSMLMFAPRKHYTHRLIRDWDWNNFQNPAKLLEPKVR